MGVRDGVINFSWVYLIQRFILLFDWFEGKKQWNLCFQYGGNSMAQPTASIFILFPGYKILNLIDVDFRSGSILFYFIYCPMLISLA